MVTSGCDCWWIWQENAATWSHKMISRGWYATSKSIRANLHSSVRGLFCSVAVYNLFALQAFTTFRKEKVAWDIESPWPIICVAIWTIVGTRERIVWGWIRLVCYCLKLIITFHGLVLVVVLKMSTFWPFQLVVTEGWPVYLVLVKLQICPMIAIDNGFITSCNEIPRRVIELTWRIPELLQAPGWLHTNFVPQSVTRICCRILSRFICPIGSPNGGYTQKCPGPCPCIIKFLFWGVEGTIKKGTTIRNRSHQCICQLWAKCLWSLNSPSFSCANYFQMTWLSAPLTLTLTYCCRNSRQIRC